MTQKYTIFNQITGQPEEAVTYADALILQKKIQQEWLEYHRSIFDIAVLMQNEDGTWTHALSDSEGNPITPV